MRSLPATLLAIALACGCRDNSTPAIDDLTSAVIDMAQSPDLPASLTIREINDLPDNTMVRVTGAVVTSPYLWIDTFAASGTSPASCRFNLFVAQPSAVPALKDGLRVTRSVNVPVDGGSPAVSACRTEAAKDAALTAMGALMPGDAVDVAGRFNVSSGTQQRSLVILNAEGVVSKGRAPAPIVPVVVTSTALTEGTAAAYREAQSMLVQLKTATVTDSGVPVAAAFKVTTDGTAKTAINTQFITSGPVVPDAGVYTAPPNGTVLKTVTGIVFPEGMGSVRIRNRADIEQ